jgi:two-component system alkaline phosphatase synthesis response regulator PhoP
LVDDEPDIIEIRIQPLKKGIKLHGQMVKKLLVKAKKRIPDLLLWMMMPEMDGMEACENIRKFRIE